MQPQKPKRRIPKFSTLTDPEAVRHRVEPRGRAPNSELSRCMRCQTIIRGDGYYCKRHQAPAE
jgi:hypothetical protein